MKWVVPALVLALAGGLALADGGGTTVEKDKPAAEKPAGNPNKAEPGLAELGWKSYDATYVPVKDWTLKTFSGGYASLVKKGDGQIIPLPVKDHDGVSVNAEEFAIEVDANHDGKMDERIKTDGAMCVVSVVYADGTVAPYAVRWQKGRGIWNWQRSGYWMATVNKTQLGIIDNNNNGKYDENGEDAISIGLTGYATPLSDVISLGGTLYNIKIEENGKKLWVKEYAGETGKLDGRTGHKSYGMLTSAVFQNGQTYIDLCTIKDKAAVIPVGQYTFFGGECKATSGGQSAMMKTGNMVAVEVKKDDTTKVAWGMDLKIDFDFDISGGVVSILVTSLHVYGSSGEEYYSFTPPAFMPVVLVTNAKTGDQEQKGSMSMC